MESPVAPIKLGQKMAFVAEEREGDLFVLNPVETDIVIAVMGSTGSGKSTFINTLFGRQIAPTSHSLSSHTKFVKPYVYEHPKLGPEHRILLLDTPGFNDTEITDQEILRRIAVWLGRSYHEKMKLAGLIYLFENNGSRMKGSDKKNHKIFEELCGDKAAKKVILGTTKWGNLDPIVLTQLEEELGSNFWKAMIKKGSTMRRVDLAQATAEDIIDFLLDKNVDDPAQIQREMVAMGKTLRDTAAAKALVDHGISDATNALDNAKKELLEAKGYVERYKAWVKLRKLVRDLKTKMKDRDGAPRSERRIRFFGLWP